LEASNTLNQHVINASRAVWIIGVADTSAFPCP